MTVNEFLKELTSDPSFMQNVTGMRTIPARPAVYADFPAELDSRVADVLRARGIDRLYSHQREAVDAAFAGRDFVVVTPTASGKTLCYNLPVLSSILRDESSRALYLFPTKALSSDQVAELYSMIEALGADIKAFTYDGDTPASARTAIRQAGHVVVTNPDMLHQGILPQHTKWVKLFENLKYVVIDEIHAYRGVFGSNLANVLRRLDRICQFYGAHPTYICCSATIKNPGELAEAMTGRKMLVIDKTGAPEGVKHVIFYNPPVVNRQLGIRAGSVPETRKICERLLNAGIKSIVFGRSRLIVEVLTRYAKDLVRDPLGNAGRVRGYRGGYLPTLRREIERELRAGNVDMVVSTNALELGIDIGQLDCCVMCGYPGTISSTRQEAGRAGRRKGESLTILVGSSNPLDQYIINHQDFYFDQSPEMAFINPDNLYILLNHLKCAAYELPFEKGEKFGGVEETEELLNYLSDQNILKPVGGKWYWMAEEFPQAGINLRSASDQNFVIVDITDPKHHRVVGEMDRFTVPMLLHKYAIYMHEGQQYQVEDLDFDDKKAYIRRVDVGYYTDADLTTSLKVLDEFDSEDMGVLTRHRGEVLVSSIVTLFKKIRFDTHENLGWGPVTLPELEMQTTACWWTLPDGLEEKYGKDELKNAMVALSYLLRHIAPMYLMCSVTDISVVYHVKDTFSDKPTLYLYDHIPGGIGLSDRVYEMGHELFGEALRMLNACPCTDGCPACTGAGSEGSKHTLMMILKELCGNEKADV